MRGGGVPDEARDHPATRCRSRRAPASGTPLAIPGRPGCVAWITPSRARPGPTGHTLRWRRAGSRGQRRARAADPLRHAAAGADALLCLGDLLRFVDYADNGQGIFADLFGAEAARRFVALRTAKLFDEARAMSAGLWQRLGGDPARHIRGAASRQYAELFAALPEPAYLTYGNVDIPHMWAEHLRPGHRVLDGERVELGGW